MLIDFSFVENGILSIYGVLFILFFGLLTASIFLTLQFQIKRNYIKRKREKIKFEIYDFFSELVFSDDQSEYHYDNQIQNFKQKIPVDAYWCKDLLLYNIINLAKNFKGEQYNRLLAITFKFGLMDYIHSLLSSGFWYMKSKGIYFLKELNYYQSAESIFPFIFSKQANLRFPALLGYISLAKKNPLDVIKEYSNSLSPLEMISLMDVIKKRKLKKPDNLKNWLSLKEDTLLIFALKLVSYYNDLDSAPEVMNLIDNPNQRVRNEVFKSIGKLLLFEAEEVLIKSFYHENDQNQIEIIRTLKEIGGQDTIEFLYYILTLKRSSEVKMAAMNALKALDKNFSKINFLEDKKLDLMKKHVEDRYLENS
ncbi:hypothetical protein BC751_3702 [Cecembia calidifontis]|uniref:HEAT repeat protein n=2 Tax=Cecembia calidifontis TaxID=1187080 RepID=A0A4Q7PEI8_9BACT|nr:hypothetical protein BC751_3702 [Cecembia calidifontis]